MEKEMIGGLLSLVMGCLFIFFAIKGILLGLSSRKWPAVQGKIIKTGRISHAEPSNTMRTYEPIISYQFEYQGKEYECNRIDAFWYKPFPSSSATRELAAKYVPNQPVTIKVNPKDPHQSVLIPGVSSALYFVLIGGTLFFFIGVFSLLGLI